MKLLNPGDCVEITYSKAGYKGPGELIGIAYGTHWLVKIPQEDGRNPLITVNAMHLNRTSEAAPVKGKPPKYDPADSIDETEERLVKGRKGKRRR